MVTEIQIRIGNNGPPHTCSGQNILSYLTPTFWNNFPHVWKYQILLTVSNMVLKSIFSWKWKTKSKIFLLIKAVRVTSTSVSNCCLIFWNISTSEGAWTSLIFRSFWNWFKLLVGLKLLVEFPLHLILVLCSKTLTFSEAFFKELQWK